MANQIELKTVLGGVEDLLLDASAPSTVTQTRSGNSVSIHKINLDTIPAVGKLGDAGFKSLKTYITEMVEEGDNIFVTTSSGGIGLVVGSAGLTWDGGTPAANEISLAQKLSNGHYRWLGKGTLGSDNWNFRGRVGGQNGVNPSDFVTKSQLDSATVQTDWNQSNTSAADYLKNKPTIPTATPQANHSTLGTVKCGNASDLTTGTDTQCRGWTAKDLKDFSQANAGSGALAIHNKGLIGKPSAPLTAILPAGLSHVSDGGGGYDYKWVSNNVEGSVAQANAGGCGTISGNYDYYCVMLPAGTYKATRSVSGGYDQVVIYVNGSAVGTASGGTVSIQTTITETAMVGVRGRHTTLTAATLLLSEV